MSARFDKNIEADSSPIGIRNLLADARSGDVRAFRELYRIFFEKIYFLFYFLTNDSTDSESYTKEVFIVAWKSIDDIGLDSDFESGLLHVVESIVFDTSDNVQRSNSLSDRVSRSELKQLYSNDELLEEKGERLAVPGRSLWPEIQAMIETFEATKAETGTSKRKIGVIIGTVFGGLFLVVLSFAWFVVSSGDDVIPVVEESVPLESTQITEAPVEDLGENDELTQLQADYEVVKSELSEYRDSIESDEKHIVEDDLDLVERSITEIVSALGDDPGNTMLERMLIKTYNKHLGLMKEFLVGGEDE